MPSLGPTELVIIVVFVLVLGAVVVGVVSTVVLALRNARRVRDAGYDPTTLHADLAVQAARSAALAPPRSLEERLRELDDLRARGVISEQEHASARADTLRG